MALFKAYDVRGTVPDELNPEVAYGIGRAIATFIGADCLAVGRDARAHSPELTEALVRGINDEGVDVYDLGLVATPMLYYAVGELGAGGGDLLVPTRCTAACAPAESAPEQAGVRLRAERSPGMGCKWEKTHF